MRNQCRRGCKNWSCRSVVCFQSDYLSARKIMLEPKDILHFSTAPRIYRLIIVTNTADVLMPLSEQTQPQILNKVCILIFVHQNVLKHIVILSKDISMFSQQLGHIQE